MNYKTTYCEKCKREYKNCNFNKHRCDRDIKFRILEEWKLDNGKYQCPKCVCSFSKMGLVGHYYRKHDDRGIKYLRDRSYKRKTKAKLTKEEKSKIFSEAMKKSYQKGISKGWDFINRDKSRRSYPEKFFIKVFENNNLFNSFDIKEKFSYGKYFIDFLFVDIKLVVEIDGSQHYRTKEAIEHDRIRDEFFINEGFKIYRVKWTDVIKNSKSEIDEFLKFIENIDNETVRRYSIDDIIITPICGCGNKMSRLSKICIKCKQLSSRKVDRPNLETLLNEVEEMGYCGVGRKYGVSDNTIRKWIKKYKDVPVSDWSSKPEICNGRKCGFDPHREYI